MRGGSREGRCQKAQVLECNDLSYCSWGYPWIQEFELSDTAPHETSDPRDKPTPLCDYNAVVPKKLRSKGDPELMYDRLRDILL